MSAGQVSSGRNGSTASWLDPESNQTSRMSRSRSNAAPPHDGQRSPSGMNSSIGRSYHASAPYSSNTTAARSTSAAVEHRFAALRAVDGRDRHTPRALPRDAPVGPVRQHVEDPVAAPGRNPLRRRGRSRQRGLAQRAPARLPPTRLAVHPDEPLRGRQEDDRVVAAPAVRVLSAGTPRGATAVRARSARFDRSDWRRTRAGRRRAPRRRGSVRRVRPARRSRVHTCTPVMKSSAPWPGAVCTAPVPGLQRHVVAEHAERVARRRAGAGSGGVRARAPLHPRDRRAKRRPDRVGDSGCERFREDDGAAVRPRRRA